jgi:uncharacterized GH25 family protein
MKDVVGSRLVKLLLSWFVLVQGQAYAHDFWIEPSSFSPASGARVATSLKVGMGFQGEPVARNPAKVRRFVLLDSRGDVPVEGEPAADPAGVVKTRAKGIAVVGYWGNHSSITLEAAEFESYLKEEGLERVIAERARLGRASEPGREIYSRCAKAILRVGGRGGAGFDRELGCRFELIPQSPIAAAGGELVFRASYQGTPLEGALVAALRKGSTSWVTARSGVDGRVALRLADAGIWLVKAVHMVPAPPESGADWESFWASVTFSLDPARP